MEFKIETTRTWYWDDDKIVKDLAELGFTFIKKKGKYGVRDWGLEIDNNPIIDIKSVEELYQLAQKFEEIIIYERKPVTIIDGKIINLEPIPTIEIYNDYRE